MKYVELVPGKAIGPVRLGARERELPPGATVAHGVGSLDHVQFTLEGGTVSDVWIDDLAGFPYEIRVNGRAIPRPATLDQLKGLLGDCSAVAGVIGGTFYNCKAGVTIGCDHDGRPTQLRLRPR